MTRFYWVDTVEEAAADAAEKALGSQWIFCSNEQELEAVDITKYEGIYLRAGINELERGFARIMKRNKPKW